MDAAGGRRRLLVLGTSSQAPTRDRNQNGYLLYWDDEAILFDPGEGTQRQLLTAGASSSAITAICITHFHGDHCLGLPGVLARFRIDQRRKPVDLYFPETGSEHMQHLLRSAQFDLFGEIVLHPVPLRPSVVERARFRLVTRPLDHRVDAVGYRVEEPDHRHLLRDRLDEAGLDGPDVGRLVRDGSIETAGGTVTLDAVSEPRAGQRFAFVMDTRPCESAEALAEGTDLLVSESTFLETEVELAQRYGHLTARQAGQLACAAGARRLVLTHYSARHPRDADFAEEASTAHPDVVAAHDLAVIQVPARDEERP